MVIVRTCCVALFSAGPWIRGRVDSWPVPEVRLFIGWGTGWCGYQPVPAERVETSADLQMIEQCRFQSSRNASPPVCPKVVSTAVQTGNPEQSPSLTPFLSAYLPDFGWGGDTPRSVVYHLIIPHAETLINVSNSRSCSM